jgi:hypothetical protein
MNCDIEMLKARLMDGLFAALQPMYIRLRDSARSPLVELLEMMVDQY